MAIITRGAKLGGGTDFNGGQIIDPEEVNIDFNTVFAGVNAHDAEIDTLQTEIVAIDDSNITTATIPGAKSLRFTEIAEPSSPSANDILLYGYGHGSTISTLAAKESSGRVIILGAHTLIGDAATERGGAVGLIHTTTIAVGTDAATTEKDLLTYTLPANALNADGATLRIRTQFITGANANTKRIRVYFGAAAMVDVGPVAWNGQQGYTETYLTRTGAATQRHLSHIVVGASGGGSITFQSLYFSDAFAANLTAAQTIKITGQNGTATANDVTAYLLLVELLPGF